MSGVLFCRKYLAMRIQCKTLFDCSATGTTGHLRLAELPFVDNVGTHVLNQQGWNISRNQQRNWETLLQLIGLRCQPLDIRMPTRTDTGWEFSFAIDSPGVFGEDTGFDALYKDCAGVPMIAGLTEDSAVMPILCVQGPDQNIWFQTINT